ncbi:MAG TPA: glycosyltransferase family 4 protein [Acidobacteriaceae bacterium]|jgi:glycosyltransferase involved in cell wall biosynthesis|nr:glycosyltransferase family 4 protein [Acidobacteriaceae bacterium]
MNLPQLPGRGRPRYLFVINDVGFIYSHFWELALSIRDCGWEVVIVGGAAADPARAVEAGMVFIPLRPVIGIGGPVSEIRFLVRLWRVFRSLRPEAVHFVSLKNVLLGGLLAKWAGLPARLGAITGMGTLFVEDRLHYRMLRPLVLTGIRRAFSGPDAVLAVENRDDRDLLLRRGVAEEDRISVIPGAGLNECAIRPSPWQGTPPVILCVSRMIRNKGILDLIEAGSLLHAQGLSFEIHLVGDIDLSNPSSYTREELLLLQQPEFIRWLGRRSDVADLLGRADVFCLPTYYREGLPRSLVEACAAGLPVVTTDVPGCRDIVVDKVTGYLVPPRNQPALAEALRSLLEDPALRMSMGAAARKRFEEQFSMTSVLSAFSKCHEKLRLPLRIAPPRGGRNGESQ